MLTEWHVSLSQSVFTAFSYSTLSLSLTNTHRRTHTHIYTCTLVHAHTHILYFYLCEDHCWLRPFLPLCSKLNQHNWIPNHYRSPNPNLILTWNLKLLKPSNRPLLNGPHFPKSPYLEGLKLKIGPPEVIYTRAHRHKVIPCWSLEKGRLAAASRQETSGTASSSSRDQWRQLTLAKPRPLRDTHFLETDGESLNNGFPISDYVVTQCVL